jgi:zinc transport system ATP-binding protein
VSTPAVELTGVSAGYDGVAAVEDVTLRVEAGEFLGVVGPNGGGKSTLLKVMLGLLQPFSGEVRLLGGMPARERVRVGYVPQFASFSRDFPVSVREVVLMGRLGVSRSWFRHSREDRAIADRCLRETEISDLASRPIGEISGGQFQRVLIARALASTPQLLILDEPTANIDPRVERDLFELLRDINRDLTVIVVSHDIGFVSDYVSRVACLNRRLICHTTEPLSGETMARLYGHPVRRVDHRSRIAG